jgi:MFS family permease
MVVGVLIASQPRFDRHSGQGTEQMAKLSGPAAHTRPSPSAWSAVVALCLIQFIDVMSVTVVMTTLPKMLADVGATTADGTLVATAYAMFFGGLLMFGARLGDRVGHRRCILGSLAVFAVGALLAATATSTLALAAARCVQGAAAAAAVPSALRLLTSVTDSGRARARAVAAWSAAGAAASASGFVVGGIVADIGSWRVIFWSLLAVSAVQAATVIAHVPPDPRSRDDQPLSLAASALLTVAVMLIVIGTAFLSEQPHRIAGVLLLGGAVVVTGLFAVVDRRSPAPLLPRAVLRRPQVQRGTAGAFVNTATTGGAATLLTFYLQSTLGRTPLETAATFLPFSVLVIGGSAAAARLIVRLPSARVAAVGLSLIGVGIAMLLLNPASAVVGGSAMAVAGFGIGLSSVTTTSMATDVPEKQRATSSGIVNTSAQLGTAIGTAVLLLVAVATTGVPGGPTATPFVAWAAAAIFAGVTAATFARIPERHRELAPA